MRWQPHGGAGRPRPADWGLVAIPLVLIAAITVLDILAPENVHLGPLLVVAPALTASFGSARLTALIGGLAVVALLSIAVIRNSVFTSNHESQLLALLVISAFTVLFCRFRERQHAELTQVRSVAEAAQQVVLQPLPERIGTLHIASAYRAAADQARIGGDLYAAVRTATGTRLLIGDVRGKGLLAVEDAALLLGAFRSAAHRELPLPALRAELDATVCWSLNQPARNTAESDESFITAVLVDLPDHRPEMSVLNCGHPAPLRLHGDEVAALAPRQYTTPIGMGLPPAGDDVVDVFPFHPGDTLVLYTDGVSETRDKAGRFYPLAERLGSWAGSASPDELIEQIRKDLVAYCHGALEDDVAMIAVRRETVAGARQRPADAHPERGLSVTRRPVGP
ncbi:PP2C family protein-serine/threonine phosphatase [Streptomyces mangrovisoli]|uniref:Protein phosphatase n=1 Tax=Streptomyces mangrovisoli TaxID=1428628 RepID=A0A1J4NYF2_9ACTN|nr:PP2C family protein-serine/threonine phosphatase [Streptomyces mangrovisoli]OIJ67379.1 protein phosphatase [Streptomyces mangrovisoli]